MESDPSPKNNEKKLVNLKQKYLKQKQKKGHKSSNPFPLIWFIG